MKFLGILHVLSNELCILLFSYLLKIENDFESIFSFDLITIFYVLIYLLEIYYTFLHYLNFNYKMNYIILFNILFNDEIKFLKNIIISFCFYEL